MIITDPTESLQLTPHWERPDLMNIRQLAQFPVALIGDAQGRMGVMHSALRSVTPGLKLAGTVLPINTREGDNLAIHRALDDAREGDVLVINANSDTNRACFGDILGEICVSRGIAGVVIDGATRDIDELLAMGLPVFARGISPAGPFKYGPGTIGAPVACGNVVCHPGDAILGDSDGLVVVPQHLIATALERTASQAGKEDNLRALIPSLG
ncbi:RraA family protein [Paeniglutamicibacter sp.]|uniref:RraA family protein n=1 Tax=Paeniglutamicibacter sp. TaxID=1934391 RepID=UPI003988CD08